jgi:hypothetical protein
MVRIVVERLHAHEAVFLEVNDGVRVLRLGADERHGGVNVLLVLRALGVAEACAASLLKFVVSLACVRALALGRRG